MNYGIMMKKIRIENSMTQAAIAEELNLKRSTYKEYELQNSIIPIKHLNEFCNYFDISIDYIFNFTNIKNYRDNKQEINLTLSSERLKTFRKEHKLTQTKLAQILNIDPSTPSKYERGRNPIATSFLYTICKKYNLSADYLLGKIDKPKNIS